jgi:Arabinose efflux permease
MEQNIEKPGSGKAWLVAVIVIIAGIICAAAKYKVAGTMTTLIPALHIDKTSGGWLLSIFSFTGIILGLPAGSLMVKMGPKKLGLIGLGFGFVGCLFGAFSNSFNLLLLSRLVEGVSLTLIGVVAPSIIARSFPPEKRGLPMGIWSLWIGLGMLFILNATNLILPGYGWHGVWWFNTLLFLIIFILFYFIVKLPESTQPVQAAGAPEISLFEGMKSPAAWVLGLVMLVLGFSVAVIQTFTPTYMQEGLGLTKQMANTYTSVFAVGNIIGAIGMGFVLNKSKNRPLILLVCTVLVAAIIAFAFEFSLGNALIFMLVTGIIYQSVPASIYAVAPETVPRPEMVGIIMGIILVFQNIGATFGPPRVGAIVQAGGWHAVQPTMLGLAIVGLCAASLFYYLMHKARQKKLSQAE